MRDIGGRRKGKGTLKINFFLLNKNKLKGGIGRSGITKNEGNNDGGHKER